MLKAAQIATTEPGPDAEKQIHQRHFIQGMEEVVAGRGVMWQSLFDSPAAAAPGGVLEQMAEGQEQLRGELGLVAERLELLERNLSRVDAGAKAAVTQMEQVRGASRAMLLAAIGAAVLAAGALVVAMVW